MRNYECRFSNGQVVSIKDYGTPLGGIDSSTPPERVGDPEDCRLIVTAQDETDAGVRVLAIVEAARAMLRKAQAGVSAGPSVLAAAPDLLAALQGFANLADYPSLIEDMAWKSQLTPGEREAFVRAFPAARAAVRKAEGRE